MKEDKVDDNVRRYLVWLLQSGDAHMTLEDAIVDFPMDQINNLFPNSTYSFWGALEHIRRTQADILDFIKNPHYQELEWPRDYWPVKGQQVTAADWNKTLKNYREDLGELIRIVKNPETQLYAKIPHGTGQTILREILLVADHTAYQLGEFVTMRRASGQWDVNHP